MKPKMARRESNIAQRKAAYRTAILVLVLVLVLLWTGTKRENGCWRPRRDLSLSTVARRKTKVFDRMMMAPTSPIPMGFSLYFLLAL